MALAQTPAPEHRPSMDSVRVRATTLLQLKLLPAGIGKEREQARRLVSSRRMLKRGLPVLSLLLLKPFDGVINRPVKEMPDLPLQLAFRVQLNRRINQTRKAHVFPQVFLGQNQGIDDFAERDAFRKAPLRKACIARLDGCLGLMTEPLSEVPIHIISSMMQFFTAQAVIMRSPLVALEVFDEALGQLFSMILDHLNQTRGKHGAPPPSRQGPSVGFLGKP